MCTLSHKEPKDKMRLDLSGEKRAVQRLQYKEGKSENITEIKKIHLCIISTIEKRLRVGLLQGAYRHVQYQISSTVISCYMILYVI